MSYKKIYYCNVHECAFDLHGKIYPILKRGENSRYINVGDKQVRIDTLEKRLRIFDFSDFIFAYIFGGLFETHPCPAMGYFVFKKTTHKKVSLKEYFKTQVSP